MSRLQQQLLSIIHGFHAKGWAEATSTNYSFRNPAPDDACFTISRSGVDKGLFTLDDFMVVDAQGQPTPDYASCKPSAETLLHTMLYANTEIGAILHTHSPDVTVYSWQFATDNEVAFKGFELQKGIEGVRSHDETTVLPMFDNSQDMVALSRTIQQTLPQYGGVYGFILKGHGLYAWGKDLATAKRHVECYEFLVSCQLRLKMLAVGMGAVCPPTQPK